MDQETRLLIDAFATCENLLDIVLCLTFNNSKSAKTSEDIRKEGNVLFSKKNHSHKLHGEILRLYNKSIALGPSGSQELASAYANRSAFLLHIGKSHECIQDIDKALEINKSDELKIKLLCRKVESLKKLGVLTYGNILAEAQSLVDKLGNTKMKKSLEIMVHQTAKLVIAKKLEANQDTCESINLSVTDNVLKKVSIRRNEKYGRHLVAKQKYKPGNIILVQKLLSIAIKPKYHYTNCHHCLKICWSGVPCDECDWAIFCSKDCYQRSWQEYHDVECSIGTLYCSTLGIPWINIPCFKVIKIFIKAMKDAGSIENLKAQVEAVDQYPDICYKGFYKNGKFSSNTIESFYSLTKRKYATSEEMTNISRFVLITLVGLTKNPPINILQIKEVKEVIQNKDIIFLGSLLLKLTAIHLNNSFSFAHFLGVEEIRLGVPQDPRGSCVASLVSLLNNSCCPNANVCFTEDGKAILYALRSIKKNEQIFTTYSKEFYVRHLEDRKYDFQKYSFECNCQACVELWPPILLEKDEMILEHKGNSYSNSEAKFLQQCAGIWKIIDKGDYHETSLKVIAPKVTRANKKFKQPNHFTCMLLDVLNKCITNTYDGLQPQRYGVCKNFK